MFNALQLLARLRFLRGTAFDVFGYMAERRIERKLITDYEATINELIGGLDHDNHALATEIASLPEGIRGYGHIKQQHIQDVGSTQAELLGHWRSHEPRAQAV
jgi:indolepyruvate ferredoxin oxidoreductase